MDTSVTRAFRGILAELNNLNDDCQQRNKIALAIIRADAEQGLKDYEEEHRKKPEGKDPMARKRGKR